MTQTQKSTSERLQSDDPRLMAVAIRIARRNIGITGTNPSVGCVLVDTKGDAPVIIGTGVTAPGGRPHAEAEALAIASGRANGATAYVTLEPCAHHGVTPACAKELIDAGISRVVTGWIDPDNRVDGRGHAMLRDAGIAVVEGCLPKTVYDTVAGYLLRKTQNRPRVLLKIAVSADGYMGLTGFGQVAITGADARAQVHMMRARADAIMIGSATVQEDDPQLTCRLPGLENRSPERFVLDRRATIALDCQLVRSARAVPLNIVHGPNASPQRLAALYDNGCRLFPGVEHGAGIALPELLSDMAERGVSELMVEGGSALAHSFIKDRLVDRIALFTGNCVLSGKGQHRHLVDAPFSFGKMPSEFHLAHEARYGEDRLRVYDRMD